MARGKHRKPKWYRSQSKFTTSGAKTQGGIADTAESQRFFTKRIWAIVTLGICITFIAIKGIKLP